VAITATQWKRAVAPALPSRDAWTFNNKLTYQTPVGWVLRGVLGEGSGRQPDEVYVWCVCMPLFVPFEYVTLTHGWRVPDGITTHSVDQLPAAAALALAEVPDEKSALKRIADGSSHEDACYALLLLGRHRRACRALATPLAPGDHRPSVEEARARMARIAGRLEQSGPEAAWRFCTSGAPRRPLLSGSSSCVWRRKAAALPARPADICEPASAVAAGSSLLTWAWTTDGSRSKRPCRPPSTTTASSRTPRRRQRTGCDSRRPSRITYRGPSVCPCVRSLSSRGVTRFGPLGGNRHYPRRGEGRGCFPTHIPGDHAVRPAERGR
jgi:hypothetical protein